MRNPIASDRRPQATTLLAAAALSIGLWFIPFGDYVTYPFRLFVTFVHEGGHAVAALLTGNSVQSLSVAMNGAGETYTTHGGPASAILIASAGYLGSAAFGALLLVLARKAVRARIVLAGSAGVLLCLTLVFGLIEPIVAGGSLSAIPFTVAAGAALSAALIAAARLAGARTAAFLVSVIAVQCVLNALLDLKTLFVLSSPFAARAETDAQNMADATHVPAIVWTVLWIAIAFAILGLAMRVYLTGRNHAARS
jgi:hypothetical protein